MSSGRKMVALVGLGGGVLYDWQHVCQELVFGWKRGAQARQALLVARSVSSSLLFHG